MGLLTRLRDRLFPSMRPLTSHDADAETEVDVCLREHVQPALARARDRLAEQGHDAELDVGDDGSVTLRTTNYNGLPLIYSVRGHVYKEGVANLASMADSSTLKRFSRIEIESGGKTREYPARRCHLEAIEAAANAYYRTFLMNTPHGD